MSTHLCDKPARPAPFVEGRAWAGASFLHPSLRQAAVRSFKDVAHLKQDSDLDPLRQREDFKQFVKNLEEAGKKK